MSEKKCTECGLMKSVSEFSRNIAHADGLQSQCKVCCAAYSRQYRNTHGREITAQREVYYEANREKELARRKRYYEAHREEGTACMKRWREVNPEKHAAQTQRRRARKAGATVEPFDERLVWERDGRECAYCGSTENLTLDHIVPLAKGGAHSPDNLCVLCKSCNSSKGMKNLGEWMRSRI